MEELLHCIAVLLRMYAAIVRDFKKHNVEIEFEDLQRLYQAIEYVAKQSGDGGFDNGFALFLIEKVFDAGNPIDDALGFLEESPLGEHFTCDVSEVIGLRLMLLELYRKHRNTK